MGLKLIKLTKAYAKQLGEMIDEWKADQKQNNTDRSPGAIFKYDCHDFDFYIAHLEIKEPQDGKVPTSVFFLLDEERDRLLGAVDIRHYLNEYLLREGGHIGDGVRPNERRKGYGTELLRLALIECRKLGIERALVTCFKDNVASAKTIQKNGGVLENEIVSADGGIMQRYWIGLGEGGDRMKRALGIARCGLACCLCSENAHCGGCNSGDCPDKAWCENRRCSTERGLKHCSDCAEDCRKGLLAKIKPYGFTLFMKRYGEEALLDCLERNARAGVVYHREGITGDYDGFDDVEALIEFIRTGKRDPSGSEQV